MNEVLIEMKLMKAVEMSVEVLAITESSHQVLFEGFMMKADCCKT